MKYFLVCATGAVTYCFIECLWRGYTHPSMALMGALCFLGIYIINEKLYALNIFKRAFLGTALITFAELLFGCVLNIGLGLDVWDYSDLYFNLLGQISLLYSFLWFLLCIPASWLCLFMRKKIFYSKV